MDDVERGSFGCSREYSYHYNLCKDNSEHGSESTDGGYIVEGKVHVNNFYWLKVTGVYCCYF